MVSAVPGVLRPLWQRGGDPGVWRRLAHGTCPRVRAPAVTLGWGCPQRFCSASRAPPSTQQISKEQPWDVGQYRIPGSTDPAGREAKDSSRAGPMGLDVATLPLHVAPGMPSTRQVGCVGSRRSVPIFLGRNTKGGKKRRGKSLSSCISSSV